MINKNHLLKGLLVAGCIIALPSLAIAAVCSDCHTMHASYDGVESTPNDHLVKGDGCDGCHADDLITNSSAGLASGNAPQVDADPFEQLAGGTFTNSTNDMGSRHDVTDIFGTTSNLLVAPGGDFSQGNLSCSSCHRNQGHHSNAGSVATTSTNGTLDGSVTGAGAGYRFLADSAGNDVYGIEKHDWEFIADATTTGGHNTYFGADEPTAVAGTNPNTISHFCGECHTDFHGQGDAVDGNIDGVQNAGAGVWIRHPTDLAFESANQATQYADTYVYDAVVPVATANLAAPFSSSDTTAGQVGIVMCLSCHRAHGSENADMLRWDYSQMVAGTGASTGAGVGCFVCHGDK